jgi:hypothetical protein
MIIVIIISKERQCVKANEITKHLSQHPTMPAGNSHAREKYEKGQVVRYGASSPAKRAGSMLIVCVRRDSYLVQYTELFPACFPQSPFTWDALLAESAIDQYVQSGVIEDSDIPPIPWEGMV